VLDDIIMTLSYLPVVPVRGAAVAVPPTQGLPKDIQRIVAQRIRAYEIAAAEMDTETRRYTTLPLYPVSGEYADEYQHYWELRTAKERQPSVPHKRVTPLEDNLYRDTKKPATPINNVQSPMATEEGWIYPSETSQKNTEETTQSTETNYQTSGPYDLPPDLQEYMGMTLDQADQNQNIDDIYEPPWIESIPETSVITEPMNTTPDKESKRAGPEITNSNQTVMTGAQSDEETSTLQTSGGGGSYPTLITKTKRTQTT
jgi:hypothetical protein